MTSIERQARTSARSALSVLTALVATLALLVGCQGMYPGGGAGGGGENDSGGAITPVDAGGGIEAPAKCSADSDCDDDAACTVDTCHPKKGCLHKAVDNGATCEDGDACTANDCPVGAGVAHRYSAVDTQNCPEAKWSGCNGLWMRGFYDGADSIVRLHFDEGAFFEHRLDGTAIYRGTARVYKLGGGPGVNGEVWEVALDYEYRGVGPDGQGAGGPKLDGDWFVPKGKTDKWLYYTLVHGTMKQVGGDATVDLTERPKKNVFPMQCGVGANGKTMAFGCSSWMDFVHHRDGADIVGHGDINVDLTEIDLSGACDTCQAGECTAGQALDCDDGDACTTDACEAGSGCTHGPGGAVCDDDDPCTIGDKCEGGSCSGVALNCDDGKPCTIDECHAACGCKHTANNGASCDDSNACTTQERCKGSKCKSKTKVKCNDGNPCTTDSCDPATGCQYAPASGAHCDDGDACTIHDKCKGGACSGGGNLNCDDGNPCTIDVCVAASGCHHKDDNGAPCDDGNVCTDTDFCLGGECAHGEKVVCDDGNPCTWDKCQPAHGCVSGTINGASCNDGNLCTEGDHCWMSLCKPGAAVTCDDGNQCTTDACDSAKGCVTSDADGQGCDDGNQCTTVDACDGGACEGSGALECDDGEVCTADGCDPATGCMTSNVDGGVCDDGNACTGDCAGTQGIAEFFKATRFSPTDHAITLPGLYGGGNKVEFYLEDDGLFAVHDDGHAHLTGTATLFTGAGGIGNAGEQWAVDFWWTYRGQGVAGQGSGGPKVVNPSLQTKAVSDTWRYFDLDEAQSSMTKVGGDGSISFVQIPAGSKYPLQVGETANDKDADFGASSWLQWTLTMGGKTTTGNQGDINIDLIAQPMPSDCDVCGGGMCVGGSPADCDDGEACTADSCDPATGACVHANNDGLACDDGSACTDADACVGGSCEPGAAISCDDGNPCTTDTCDSNDGCGHGDDNGAPCNDGSACTAGDTCAQGACAGAVVDCNDGNACTADSCDAQTGCAHADADGTPCSDGNFCTSGDACGGGACQSGGATDCDDSNACTTDACDAVTGCTHAATAGQAGSAVIVSDSQTLADGAPAVATWNAHTSWTAVVPGAKWIWTEELVSQPKIDTWATFVRAFTLPGNATGLGGTMLIAADNSYVCTLNGAEVGADATEQNYFDQNKDTWDLGGALQAGANELVCIVHNWEQPWGNAYSNPAGILFRIELAWNEAAMCDDGDACTAPDLCDAGQCKAGAAIDCDDGAVCTTDTCDAGAGCVHANADGADCDDGDACTGQCESKPGLIASWVAKRAIGSGHDHAIWLPGFNGGNAVVRMKFESNARFDVYANGTAQLSGTATIYDGGGKPATVGEQWWLDVHYTFRGVGMAGQGGGGPKREIPSLQPKAITDTWQYFDLKTGAASLENVATGELVTFTEYPTNSLYPFQVGTAANGKNAHNGASQWFVFDRNAGPCKAKAKGDFNLDFDFVDPKADCDSCQGGSCGGAAVACDDGDACTADACDAGGGCSHAPLKGASCN